MLCVQWRLRASKHNAVEFGQGSERVQKSDVFRVKEVTLQYIRTHLNVDVFDTWMHNYT